MRRRYVQAYDDVRCHALNAVTTAVGELVRDSSSSNIIIINNKIIKNNNFDPLFRSSITQDPAAAAALLYVSTVIACHI